MMFLSIWSDATKTTTALMEAAMENAKAAQETMVRQSELASKMESPWSVKWTSSPIPMPVLSFQGKGAETTREAFHLMADMNISSWENAAKVYSAMPAWMKAPYRQPGEFWAKWFDQFQDGKFDAPFTLPATSVFDAFITSTTPVPTAANETSEAETEFNLKSPVPSDTAKPELLTAPEGEADDLTQIKGIGPKLQKTLSDLGVYHFRQIAAWTPENLGWLDERLAFKGRIQREGWVEQAQNLLKRAA